jgi:hypothetical protein
MLLLGCDVAWADPTDERHGAVHDGFVKGVEFEGGVTVTAQHADDSAVDNELFGSLDLVTKVQAGPGNVLLYVEGNSTPRKNGVASLIGEANGDAGSALDDDDNGRLQVSELHYTQGLAAGEITLGLLDVTGFLDTNAVANDETTQFLGASFVTNPTIEFPDYTLGGAYHQELAEDTSLSLVLTSSNGLGDNPERSYSELTDVGDDGKGVFTAIEGGLPLAGAQIGLGAWLSTADHDRLDGTATDEDNYGVYSNIDFAVGEALVNVRLGWADDTVSQADTFIGVAAEIPTSLAPLGVAIGQIGLADAAEAPGLDDTTQAEVYLRFELHEQFQITPSVQWIENTGFDSSDTVLDDSQTVYSLRGNYTF